MNSKPWGLSCSIDLKNCDHVLITRAATIQDYIISLCKLIDMVRYGDVQIVNFGTGDKKGYTVIQLIETSNITGHFSNDTNSAYIDLFSCKEFDPNEVTKFSQNFMKASKATMSYIYRG